MFIERLISGIILVILTIAAIWAGHPILLGVVCILSLIGQFELYRVLKLEKSVLGIAGYVATIGYELLLLFDKENYIQVFLLAMLLVFMAIYVILYPKYTFKEIAMTFTGLVYVTMMLSCLYQVRCMNGGVYLVWIVFIAAWGSDTCAYCVGKLIGKHKLPTKLSPKKTIEGCTGGVVGAMLIAGIYAYIFKEPLAEHGCSVALFTIVGGFGAICSQIGDLAASAIKRNYEIKDYGTLIPGHGGIMDRFDSILFTAPLAFIFFTFL